MQSIGRSQSRIAIGALHELVAKSRSPLRSERGRLRQGLDAQSTRIVSTNLHGKGIVETKRRAERQAEPRFILALHAPVNFNLLAANFLFEDGGQRGPRVFGININA